MTVKAKVIRISDIAKHPHLSLSPQDYLGKEDELMMEKYGVDLSNLPPDDDQIRELKKLAGEKFTMPKNKLEADEMIEKLAGEHK